MKLGARLASLVISDIRSMSRACEAASGINLGQGICDLPTPLPVAAAAREAISLNKVIYTAPEGLAGLSMPDSYDEELSRSYAEKRDFCFAKENDVLEEAARRLRAL